MRLAGEDPEELVQVIETRPEGQDEGNGEEKHAEIVHVDQQQVGANAEEPVVIVMQQQAGDGDHLVDGLVFAQIAGVDDDPFRRGDRAQAGDDDLPGQHQEHRPGRHAAVGDEHDQGGHDDQLVGQRIEKLAEHRHHAPLAGQPAVDKIGHRGNAEDGCRPEARLAGIREHDDDDQGDRGDPGQGQEVGEVETPGAQIHRKLSPPRRYSSR